MIKTGGENVSSLEVERALYECETRIKEVAVVGLPHDKWVEAITAMVITHPGTDLTEEEVLVALGDSLPGYKKPKTVIIVSDFPRTATGKIQKNEIRKLYADHYSQRGQ